MFDVHWPVTAARSGHEQVGLAYSTSDRVSLQSPPDDDLRSLHKCELRGLLQLSCRAPLHNDGLWNRFPEFGHDVDFESPASLEAALKLWRWRDRHRRDNRVVLCAHRALLRHISSLRRDRRDVTGPHGKPNRVGAAHTPSSVKVHASLPISITPAYTF